MDPAFASEVRGYMSVTDRSGHLCPVLSLWGGGWISCSLALLSKYNIHVPKIAS